MQPWVWILPLAVLEEEGRGWEEGKEVGRGSQGFGA